VRFLATLFLSLSLIFASPAYAGVVNTAGKVYTTYQVAKIGFTVLKYGRQLHKVSKFALNSRQYALLKKCFQDRSCASFIKNPTKWDKTVRDRAVKAWEQHTGSAWPRHTNVVYGKNGNVLARIGDPYEAHHVIPKQIGGPHAWWNMHPVPRPEHQSVVHASKSFLNQIMEITK
jgi:hypothetical protein